MANNGQQDSLSKNPVLDFTSFLTILLFHRMITNDYEFDIYVCTSFIRLEKLKPPT